MHHSAVKQTPHNHIFLSKNSVIIVKWPVNSNQRKVNTILSIVERHHCSLDKLYSDEEGQINKACKALLVTLFSKVYPKSP